MAERNHSVNSADQDAPIRHTRFSHGELSGSTWPGVSIILPILNEENYLEDSIDSILSQEYQGSFEVILALGPSRDKTNEIAQRLASLDQRVKLVDSPTGRTAAGLNLAIAASSYPIIVRIDGHAQVAQDYVAKAVSTLLRSGAVNVGGVMAAQGVTPFEKTVSIAMRSPLGVGSSRFHTGGHEGSVDTVYLGCFEKAALIKAGGYDERFTRAQDWELNFRLRSDGGVIWFNPDLIVLYRPRPSLKKLASQYFQYGRWRHAVVRSHKGSVNYRYLAPPTLVATLIASLIASAFAPIFALIPTGYFVALCVGSAVISKGSEMRMRTVLQLPWVIATMHISWGLGYLTSPPGLIVVEDEEI